MNLKMQLLGAMIAKLPTFDPAWPVEVRAVWSDIAAKLIDSILQCSNEEGSTLLNALLDRVKP